MTKPTLALTLGVLLIAVSLRAWRLHDAPLDFDEVYEATHAAQTFAEVYSRADDFPPLYGWLVGGWVGLLGEALGVDAAGRWFSALAGVLGVAAVGWLGAEIGGRRLAGWSALLAAVSANHVLYSQQFRAYGLYMLLATLVMAAAWRLRRRGGWPEWGLFGATSWLALGTHYYSALLITPMWLMVFAAADPAGRRRALGAAAAFCVACLAWVPALRADLDQPPTTYTARDCDLEAYGYTYLTLVTGFTLGPAMHELREVTPLAGAAAMAPWAVAGFAAVVALLFAGRRDLAKGDLFWLLLLLFATPAAVAAIAAASPTGYVYRHFNWVLIPLIVLLAAGASRWRRNGYAAAATLVLLGLSLTATANRHLNPRYHVDDFHAVEALLTEEGPDRPVLTLPRYFGKAARYHLADRFSVTVTSCEPGEPQDWRTTLPEFAALAPRAGKYWLVVQHYPADEPDHELIQWLLGRLGAEWVTNLSSTIDVYEASGARFRDAVEQLAAEGFTPPSALSPPALRSPALPRPGLP